MDAKLIIVGGKASKAEIALRLPTIIGRSRDADLTVAHSMVSRQHCELYEEGGVIKIRDLGSLNGTFVGKQQIREADLYPNAEFTIGPLTFRVKYKFAGKIAPPPQPAATVHSPEPGQVEPLVADAVEVLPEFVETERQPPAGFSDVVEMAQSGDESPEPPPPPRAEGLWGIAPADGGLPDFSAWDARQRAESADDAAQEAAPPAGLEPPAGGRGVLDDEGGPLLEAPLTPVDSDEESTAQFQAPDVPSGGGSPGEEQESADDLPPPERSLKKPKPAPSDRLLDDFLKGLE